MTADAGDTEELIERASQGDSRAVETLLAAHRDRLRRMVAARLDSRVLARVDPSDVVQETMAEAAAALPRYLRDRPIPFLAWLRQFAWQRLVKLHRYHIHAQRRSVTREEDFSPELPDESLLALTRRLAANGTSPSQAMIRDESRRKVRDALAELTSSDREILLMHIIEQMTMAEVAGVLGITEGAAKVRHLRALRRLGALLDQPR
jgi:RNA polymerase sigma-70 factor, ECF subfamily